MHGFEIEILGIEILTGSGADLLLLETSLPQGEWPFEGTAKLSLRVAADEGAAYAARYFPGVPYGITRTGSRLRPRSAPLEPRPPWALDGAGEGEVG